MKRQDIRALALTALYFLVVLALASCLVGCAAAPPRALAHYYHHRTRRLEHLHERDFRRGIIRLEGDTYYYRQLLSSK